MNRILVSLLIASGTFGLPCVLHAQEGPPPEDAPKPTAVSDLKSALAQTSVILEGVVREASYSYDETQGTWTRVTLSDLQVHGGRLNDSTTELSFVQFGGVKPNGNFVSASNVPILLEGNRYLLFMRNTAWGMSPLIPEFSVRLVEADGRLGIFSIEGQSILGLDAAGLRFDSGEPQTDAAESESVATALDVSQFLTALEEAMVELGVRPSGPLYTEPDDSFRSLFGRRTSGEPTVDDARPAR